MNEPPEDGWGTSTTVDEVPLSNNSVVVAPPKGLEEEMLVGTEPEIRLENTHDEGKCLSAKRASTKRASTTFAKRGSRPQSLAAAMAGQEQGVVEHGFFVLGNIIAIYAPLILLVSLLLLSFVAAFGLFMRAEVDNALFTSLVLRPATRLNKESNYVKERFGEGWETTMEVANAIATSGGKNVLTRKNALQTANFWRDLDLGSIEIKYRNTKFNAVNVLALSGPQPFRFNILDCWQEGAYDFFGDLGTLGIQGLVDLSYEATYSFAITDMNASYLPSVNPYTWCLYAPLVTLYTPFDFVDANTFGRCRQFLDTDVSSTDQVVAVLERAHDFHRFYLYDLAKSSPSLAFTWGCKVPFADEPAGRCDTNLTCCEIATVYSGCASGGLDLTTCDAYLSQFGAPDWSANPHYDSEYAALKVCDNFRFYPVGSILAGAISSLSGLPANTSLAGCSERITYYQDEDSVISASLADVTTVNDLAEFAAKSIICNYFGMNSCATTFESSANFDWTTRIATEDEILATGLSGTCAFWDGGPEGLKILPYVDLTIALGDWFDDRRANYGFQVVYVAKGWRKIDQDLEMMGITQPKSHCKHGKSEWLAKLYSKVKGRYNSGSVLHGMLTSTAIFDEFDAAGSIEIWLIAICYSLVVIYAGSSMIFEVTGGPSITLTTTANFVAFLTARAIRVRMVAEFCAQAAVGVLGIYFSIVFGFIALLGVHAKVSQEYKATHISMEALLAFGSKKPNVEPEHTKKRSSIAVIGAAARGSVAVVSQARKNFYHEVLIPNYAWFLTHPSGKMFILMATAILILVGCLAGLPRVSIGFPIVDLFPWGTPGSYFMYNRMRFSQEPIDIVYGEADYPYKHPLIASVVDPTRYSTLQQAEDADHIAPGTAMWYHAFIQWGLPCDWRSFSHEMNVTSGSSGIEACDASNFYGTSDLYNPRCDPTDAFGAGYCGPFVSPSTFSPVEHALAGIKTNLYSSDSASPKLAEAGIPVCTSWPISVFLCNNASTRCFQDHLPNDVFNNPYIFGFHPDYFYVCLNKFLNFDALHTLFSPAFTCVDPDHRTERIACTALAMGGSREIYRGSDGQGYIDFFRASPVWAEDIEDGYDWVEMLDSLRDNMNNAQRSTQIRAFPSGGVLPFWSQFRWLVPTLVRGLSYTLLCIFAIVSLIYVSIQPPDPNVAFFNRVLGAAWSSLLLCVLITMVVIMFLAVCGYVNIILNIFTAVLTILTVGMSVEFVSHFFSHYLLHSGSRVEKTIATLKLLLPPVIDGSITTLLGIVPLCFSPMPYIVNNFVQPFFIIVGLGIFFGLVSLPAILATVGWQDGTPNVCCAPTFGAPQAPDTGPANVL
ncbi:hypothetical protein AURANDRAFT_67307 [Aureococcus anophagefferens]|uniref:SSD domain-containing protein n=1 Tax=Aureococcus anophagefferens TaxID=44056 RepID=F0YKQ3_AURAN|nr:hypothetical protein AURANDRAFT_67307 [Aureococcus anophagefferens]EGB04274.1 hypothetical protein AURANDRAFT_67307 [Aureococcus anophagefferens]|eukprot:XP_009040984.1 hypothetical protein AURANDRAFT_67307 [Aureococcus anophagefferens]